MEIKEKKKHITTKEIEIKKLLSVLSKSGKDITIINESPSPVKDSLMGLKIYKEIK
jgi:hypothetical protein